MTRMDEYNTFCLVIDLRSFSRAAETLNLTQPAVSLQVRSLEDHYGVELVHRQGFEVLPTENGRRVYDYARRILNLYEESLQDIQNQQGVFSGSLRVGASSGPGEWFVPLLLGAYKQEHPEVEVRLQVGDSGQIIEDILNHRLELGFVGYQRRDRYLNFESYLSDDLVLVVNPGHPWAAKGSITYEDFLGAPLILQQRGSGVTNLLIDTLRVNGIALSDLNVVMELGLQESTKQAVCAGYGVTLISQLGVLDEIQRGALVRVEVEGLALKREIYICSNRMAALSNLAQNFLAYALKNKAKILPAGK